MQETQFNLAKLTALPRDAGFTGKYIQTRPFHYEMEYESVSAKFCGTEKDFYNKGLAYQYDELDKHTRFNITRKEEK